MKTPERKRKDQLKALSQNGDNKEFEKKSYVSFDIPTMNRDQQIYLGQSIIALIALNLPTYLSDKDNKEDIGLMLLDVLKHFDVSLEDLYKMDLIENHLDSEYTYKLKVDMRYEILKKEL